ncbi:unnamed protein product [Diatraea saccharalis]|uniref:Serpin domain-containing protein n=1 Tax=Diatraea saccharalis TaxID=40085 RepID=A0A9P0C775_9NEOP|nr:unnamed protein product [Diatraea saccharalis]
MERLKNTHEYKYNQPELKNYFYIYKNYTINEDYKKILEDYYLTEVRSVERYYPDHEFNKPLENDENSEFVIDLPDKQQDVVKNDDIPELMPPKESDEKLISFAVDDKPDKIDITHIEYKPAKNIKEKIKLVKYDSKKEESGDEEETMVAVEARNHARSLKVLQDKNDITSSISVNSVGRKSSKKPSNSLMIIFNGMYFRGSWKKPFDVVEPGVFYKSSKEKKQVPMMKTIGSFKTGYLPGLDSEAIQIPYEGGRYALVVMVPRSRDGLQRLSAELGGAHVTRVGDHLQEEELQLALPTFYVETTTKPVAALAKFGVSSIFSREAELSGVSSNEGLFVQELVQHVAVRVDNADSSANQLAVAEAVEELKNLPLNAKIPRRFNVEHPFLFYIIDCLDNLVVVAGKITDPEQPTPFEI